MIKKRIMTQYFLHFGDQVLHYGEDKQLIFSKYQKLCEENPNKHYYIFKVETIKEVVAMSADARQSLFDFV
jgi:hypothetical protein